jgi:hypothetical protein
LPQYTRINIDKIIALLRQIKNKDKYRLTDIDENVYGQGYLSMSRQTTQDL